MNTLLLFPNKDFCRPEVYSRMATVDNILTTATVYNPDDVAYEKFIKAKKHTFGSGYFSTDVYRIGKKKAGNLLGKKQWLEFPKVKEMEAGV